MRVIDVPIKDIYVPSAKAKTLDEEKIMPLAEDILENGQKTPIYVRKGKDRCGPNRECGLSQIRGADQLP